jgi:hypothetical protein
VDIQDIISPMLYFILKAYHSRAARDNIGKGRAIGHSALKTIAAPIAVYRAAPRA